MSNEEMIIEENIQEESTPEEVIDEKPVKKEFTVKDLPGVGPATAEKLADAGFDTLLSIAVASNGQLADAAGISESVARKIIQTARSEMDMGFESGLELLERRKKVFKVTTGSKAFDAILDGGFEAGCISECYGQYGSSKTQIANALAVNVQLPKEKGGVEGMAVYIDGEGSFRPERIKQLATGAGLDPDEVLNNIKVARAFNSDHQMILVDKIDEMITKDNLPIKLVIVDSLTSHFRAEFIGRGTLSERQQKLNKHMHGLMKLAANHNIIVYVTNQVMAKPDTFFGDPNEAIGGNIVGHNSTFRIYLRRGKKGSRVAKLVDAPNLPDAEAMFFVKEEGIRDD
ncbi:DNA repair and recombination protein RadA [Candidatus Woesearchaeota archaeon]|jgi:DNA repair protein RadA|nr:DNA repair and recombination protein RadA [Candidatus Woesearchaeota archaeon]